MAAGMEYEDVNVNAGGARFGKNFLNVDVSIWPEAATDTFQAVHIGMERQE